MEKGLIFDIRHFSVHDGPGIRSTVFLKGCPLRCLWCHNPESQKFEPETIQRVDKLDGKEFCSSQTIGRFMTVDEVFNEIRTHVAIFDETAGGVTFSGGEPLLQPQFLKKILKLSHSEGISTAIDTCGFASKQVLEEIFPFVNLFLYDLKIISPEKHESYTGQSNSIILKNLAYLDQLNSTIFVRVPLIPGITDDTNNLTSIKGVVQKLPSIKRLDLLPYHQMARDKYRRMNLPYGLEQAKPYTPEKLNEIKSIFDGLDIPISIGG